MSQSQSEYGTLLFTKKGFSELLTQFKTVFNTRQEKLFALAKDAYEKVKGLPAAQRKDALLGPRYECQEGIPFFVFHHLSVCRMTGRKTYANKSGLDDVEIEQIAAELMRGKDGALCKPRAMAFAKAPNGRFAVNVGNYGRLVMDPQTLTLIWRVDEGNRSVDRNSDCVSYGLYFSVLRKYAWKRGEGGTFQTEFESMADDGPRYEHNTSAYFGPRGEEVKAHESRLLDAKIASYKKFARR